MAKFLCGLDYELLFIAGINILEELQMDVAVWKYPCRTEDWSAFDSVLTESSAFPILHRVSVKTWGNSDCKDQDDLFKKDILMEAKFPRLMESKAVEFKFSAEINKW